VTVECQRRLAAELAERRLSEAAAVDYLIDLPYETSSDVGQQAWLNLESESVTSLSQKLEVAVVAAGLNVVLNVTNIVPASVEAKTTTTTTTVYCDGEPPCGGPGFGTCIRAPQDDVLGRWWLCDCLETYNGSDCSERACPTCQNNGTCAPGNNNLTSLWGCSCPETHQGDRCEFLRCPSDCNNAGDCDQLTGVCSCFDGYSGDDCGLAPSQLVPITNTIELSLTWGLAGYEEVNNSAPVYDSNFDLFDAETQAWILDTCEAARASPVLLVREELPCWIEGFQGWIQAVGGPFPVENSELASEALQAFMHRSASSSFLSDVATDGEDFAGRPFFTRVRFKINVAANADMEFRTSVREKWDEWVVQRNAQAPVSAGPMLMVSYFWTQMELESQVLSSTMMAFGGSMATSLIAVAFFTQNAVIALYVCLNILLVVCVLAGFLLYWQEYEFGVVEAIGATIFVGLSVDYCLHLAHAYNESPGKTSLAKMKRTLVVIGPSIMGGAITTIAGTAFLIPCRMILFQKLGWTLFANAIVSVVFTFTFLTPLFIIIGPTGTAGTIYCFPCLRRFAPKEHSKHHHSGNTLQTAAEGSPRGFDEEAPDGFAIPDTIPEGTEAEEMTVHGSVAGDTEGADLTPASGLGPVRTSSDRHDAAGVTLTDDGEFQSSVL